MHLTQGIVLAKKDMGEADILYTIYTKEYGKIRAYAQGIKKEGAKLRGHLEILSAGTIGFVVGKRSPRLVYAKLIYFWQTIRNDFNYTRAAMILARWVDAHSFPGLADEPIYAFLMEQLHTLEKGVVPARMLQAFLKAGKQELIGLLGGERSVGSSPSYFRERF